MTKPQHTIRIISNFNAAWNGFYTSDRDSLLASMSDDDIEIMLTSLDKLATMMAQTRDMLMREQSEAETEAKL